jgi:hypothetical protein
MTRTALTEETAGQSTLMALRDRTHALHPDLVKRNRKRADQIEFELRRAQQHARDTLQSLPAGSRHPAYTLYAAAPAGRLFRWYDARPEEERRSYSLTWRPVLKDVWDHLAGDRSAYVRISRALGEFSLSPYSNNGDDGPDDIDQDEAAATYFTANCVIHGIVDFALLSASRATDNLDLAWYGKDEERRQTEITREIRRQAADLDAIIAVARKNPHLNQGVPEDLITTLRA